MLIERDRSRKWGGRRGGGGRGGVKQFDKCNGMVAAILKRFVLSRDILARYVKVEDHN